MFCAVTHSDTVGHSRLLCTKEDWGSIGYMDCVSSVIAVCVIIYLAKMDRIGTKRDVCKLGCYGAVLRFVFDGDNIAQST